MIQAHNEIATSRSKPQLLLVEDEEHLAFSLEFNLKEEGYAVDIAPNYRNAVERLDKAYDVVVLDVMLPDGSGLDLCRQLRKQEKLTPVLFLTAKDGPDNTVAGLEAGGDDYLTKPFSLNELLGRLSALLRRRQWDRRDSREDERQSPAADGPTVHFGRFCVDRELRTVSAGEQKIELTELEFLLLCFFIDNAGRVISREELLQSVWRVAADAQTRVVDNFVVRLRRHFEDDPRQPKHFLTVRSRGYRFRR